MSLLSRRKGKVFERKVAALVRERFPWLAEGVRRSIQSRKAEESDVTGLPGFWLECQDAADPEPLGKLLQAERDVAASETRKWDRPVAVTHKKASKVISATMRASTLIDLATGVPVDHLASLSRLSWTEARARCSKMVVTMSLEDFFDLVEAHVQPTKPVRKVVR